ncbi:MAG: hypothetical protein K0U36_04850 [Alphaproteobacteria bacterium]|nr:hypothetical protein [Alphaproteobacteria bacterium]
MSSFSLARLFQAASPVGGPQIGHTNPTATSQRNPLTSSGISDFLAQFRSTDPSAIQVQEAIARLQAAGLNAAIGDNGNGKGNDSSLVPGLSEDFLSQAGGLLNNPALPAGIDPIQAAFALRAATSNAVASPAATQGRYQTPLSQTPASSPVPSATQTAAAQAEDVLRASRSPRGTIDSEATYWDEIGHQPVASQHLVSMRSALAHYEKAAADSS